MKALIDCIEPIPCNPCETSCPFGAITVGEEITALPRIDLERCKGCGICLAVCPGLAIRLLETPSKGAKRLSVAFVYEYPDLPSPGEFRRVVDETGNVIGKGKVEKIQKPLKDDPTQIVYISVDSEIAEKIHSLERMYGEDL